MFIPRSRLRSQRWIGGGGSRWRGAALPPSQRFGTGWESCPSIWDRILSRKQEGGSAGVAGWMEPGWSRDAPEGRGHSTHPFSHLCCFRLIKARSKRLVSVCPFISRFSERVQPLQQLRGPQRGAEPSPQRAHSASPKSHRSTSQSKIHLDLFLNQVKPRLGAQGR